MWPLFGLEIESPRLLLRPVRDEDLPGLADAALAGVHDPGRMPFSAPWTDAAAEDLPRNLATYQWGLRGRVSPSDWVIPFGVHVDGTIIGVQDLAARHFAELRTVSSGSWITRSAHGDGIGTEMRQAMLLFAFDHLGAAWAESSAMAWNAPSLGVSRKLGYRDNGVTRVATRPGEVADEQRVRLARAEFRRPSWEVTVRGAEPALAQLGVATGAPA